MTNLSGPARPPSPTFILNQPLPVNHHSGRPGSRGQGEHTINLSSLNPTPIAGNASITKSNGETISSARLLGGIFGRRHRISSSYISLYRPLKTKRERGILCLGIFLALAAGVPLPLIGVIFGRLINSFPPNEEQIKRYVGELLGVAVAFFCITWGWTTCWGVVGERVSRGLREGLLQKAIGMDISWFEVEAPDIAHRLTADTQTIQLGTSEKVGLFLASISYFVAAFITGFILNARLTGIMFAAVVPTMFLTITFGSKFISKYAGQASEHSAKATVVAEGAINAVQVVQSFDALDRLAEEHMKFMEPAVRAGIKKALGAAAMLGLVYFIAYAANALAFWEGSRQIVQGLFKDSEGAGTVYTVVFLILDASFVVGQFGPFLQTFALAAAAGQKIIALLDRPQPFINVYSTEGQKMPQPVEENDLSLHDVTFVYPARAAVRVVEHLNLTFPAGKVTAIVGSSGSGKSTIAAMLMRFYDPSSGRVQIGRHDLRELNVREYRKHVALVDQQAILFSGTVMDNIKHGLLHVEGLSEQEKEKQCIQAAKDANAWDFIMDLPNGFDTLLGGGGSTELSGGQRQRISVARALVSDPSILLLDEPTSALDSVSETIVLEALEKAKTRKGRTTIMIAHRLATIQRADKIVVMGSGHVLEEGSHETLLEKRGAYYDLVTAQKLLTGVSSASSISSAITKVEDNSHLINKLVDEKLKDNEEAIFKDEEVARAKKEYSTATLVHRCLSLSKPDAWIIMIGLVGSLMTGGLIVGESIVFGNLISILNEENGNSELTSRANFFSLIFFIIALIALVAYIISGSAFGIVSERLIRRIRDISLRTILRQDVAWFQLPGNSSSALVSMLSMDAGHISGLSGVILGTICSVTTSMVSGIVLAHVVAWKIAIVLLAAVPVMVGSGFLRLRILARMEQRHESAYLKAAALATEACSAMRTIAALGREQDVSRLYSLAIEKPYRESLRFIIFGNFWLAFALSITYFVYALGYYWGSRQVRNGDYDTLQFFIVLPALLFSAQASGQMFSLAPEITRARSAAQSIFDLHDQKPTIDLDPVILLPSGEKAQTNSDIALAALPATAPLAKGKGKVEFRDIHFTYAGRPAPVLKGVSLTIKPGTFVAFVGASGAGKTTALSLIERFHDPTSGLVLINDSDIRSVPVRQHRGRIALVAQDPCLFPGSISFNISLGATPGVLPTEADIERVCKMVGLHEFILSLPQAYATDVGTNGSLLSGGQKQRIALARALIRDPEILLLDEATSALDSVSEQLVQQSIAAASKGRTCVAIAHRLASVQRADWIYVFESGRVMEAGRHEELQAAGGRYAQMCAQQTLA